MVCPNCKKEVIKVRTIYRKGTKIVGCRNCLHTQINPCLFMEQSYGRGKYKMTPLHRRDIECRKVDIRSGEVYRDYGRKYFI